MAALAVRPVRIGASFLLRSTSISRPASNAINTVNANIAAIPHRFLPHHREFHATPKPQYIEPLLSTTQTLLDTIHDATHLSWALSLPLAALLIRLTITLPMTIYTRRVQQTQYNLQPLVSAWRHHTRATQMATSGHLGPAAVERNTQRGIAAKTREIYRRWGCQRSKLFLPILQLPVWLVVVETIRRMSGSHKGLLGLVTDWSSNEKTQDAASSGAATTSDYAMGSLAAGGPLDALEGATLTSESVANAAVTLEPSMATEGILWFTDLTAPDPMLTLPFMLSASLFLNIYSKETSIDVPYLQRSKGAQRWTRVLGMVALAAGPLTLQVPSAMLVYWISSSLMGYGQFILLDNFMRLKPPPKPCKPSIDALPQNSVPI